LKEGTSFPCPRKGQKKKKGRLLQGGEAPKGMSFPQQRMLEKTKKIEVWTRMTGKNQHAPSGKREGGNTRGEKRIFLRGKTMVPGEKTTTNVVLRGGEKHARKPRRGKKKKMSLPGREEKSQHFLTVRQKRGRLRIAGSCARKPRKRHCGDSFWVGKKGGLSIGKKRWQIVNSARGKNRAGTPGHERGKGAVCVSKGKGRPKEEKGMNGPKRRGESRQSREAKGGPIRVG